MDKLLSKNDYERAKYLYTIAVALEDRLDPKFEKFILVSTKFIKLYAEDVIGDRWPEGEKAILKILESNNYNQDAIRYAIYYAIDILKDRWPEIEPYIVKDSEHLKSYLEFVNNKGYKITVTVRYDDLIDHLERADKLPISTKIYKMEENNEIT